MIDDIGGDTIVVVAEAMTGTDGAGESMQDLHPGRLRSEELLTEDSPAATLRAAEAPMEDLPPEELAQQPVLGGNGSAGTVEDGAEASSILLEASVALTHDSTTDQADDVASDGYDTGASDDLTGMTADREASRADAASAGLVEASPAEVVSPGTLVATLLDTAAPRRNKRRSSRDGQAHRNDPALAGATVVDEYDGSSTVEEPPLPAELILPIDVLPEPMADEEYSRWREQWPMNEVRMVGRLLARSSDAPALDGVQRTRMELALVEQHGDEFGSMGTLPIFVMPGAIGFTPIASEIRRARREKRRLAPITVEVQGILRQLPDRDGRYATERYRVLMGVEVHRITRLADDAEQFAYWRGRATVTASRRYEYRGIPYQRVTAVVELKQRKPRLRGTSITHLPVDFLVAPAHEHADRFEHIGQRLLIEATITPETQRMNDNHPDLLGIDDPRRKAQLQVLRESIVCVTMGEFPDGAAERAYEAWVTAGRPRPERRVRTPRLTAPRQAAPVADISGVPDQVAEPRRGRQQASSSHAGEQKRARRV